MLRGRDGGNLASRGEAVFRGEGFRGEAFAFWATGSVGSNGICEIGIWVERSRVSNVADLSTLSFWGEPAKEIVQPKHVAAPSFKQWKRCWVPD